MSDNKIMIDRQPYSNFDPLPIYYTFGDVTDYFGDKNYYFTTSGYYLSNGKRYDSMEESM